MTAASIGAGDAQGYSAYLLSRTVAPSRGDYYLSGEGLPTEAPGIWQMLDGTQEMLGIQAGSAVSPAQLEALMEGRHPATGEHMRAAGADGRRAAGIDLTFSAPKSVSVVWALGSAEQRAGIEAAHGQAVERTLEHLRREVPVVRSGAGGEKQERARDVIAAEFRHTTARGVQGGTLPDPQLHSHVVVTGVVRNDGRVAAVASRQAFRSARELGSFYRAALAGELREKGYGITAGTGKDGRYFEITGVPEQAKEALSGRSREVWLAAERFRAKYGRAPQRGELRNLKLENRQAKTPQTRGELNAAWQQSAGENGLSGAQAQALQGEQPGALERGDARGWQERAIGSLTADRATFTAGELRAAVLEQGLGELSPEQVSRDVQTLISSGEIIELEGERFTTREVREAEKAIIERVQGMAAEGGREISEHARDLAALEVGERIGAPLSQEQQQALATLTGPEHAAVLVGQAGTGKGVVIDAAARAEQNSGRQVWGVAVAGATAERLGADSPALEGRTSTLDSLVARAETGSVSVDADTTVYFDEAGMGDSSRLDALSKLVSDREATLITVGDAKQLPSIGPGGLFGQLTQAAPTAELTEIYRTSNPAEQRTWADLRAGRAEQAMAHYHANGQLHISDTREQALEAATQQWVELAEREGASNVALISDASTSEIDRLNARAQHLLTERGQLGEQELQLPDVTYGIREGDRVAFISQHHPGGGQPRVENGSRGQITHIDPDNHTAELQLDVSEREVTLAGEQQLSNLRLAYAQHLYRQQGATVQRAVVVTGGWQTSKEGAYVEASRAREGTDWHVSREDLGTDGQDPDRIERLAEMMRVSNTQTPSIAYQPATNDTGQQLAASTETALEHENGVDHDQSLNPDAGLSL
jgi:conjugative relaxase-like TrwC/TraI family protein